MVLQHVRALLKADGMMDTVMPHPVLFRSRSEQEIRQSIIEENLLEVVIGLPPNVFCGTGIPASILVLRPPGARPPERRNKALFINAECRAGRARKHPMPEQIETIATITELYYVERHPGVEVQLQVEAEKGTGGGLPRLALFRIRNLRVACPPPEEQTRMAGVLSAQGARIGAEKAPLDKLRQGKRG